MSDQPTPTAAEDWQEPTLQENLDALSQAGNEAVVISSLDRAGTEVLVTLEEAGVLEARLANIRKDRNASPEAISDAATAFRTAEANAQTAITNYMAAAAAKDSE